MSTLSAFSYIPERAEAVPALWNNPLSIISANIAAVDSTLLAGHFQQLSVGSTPPSYLTTAAVTIEVNSAYSDYLYFVDSSAQKSSYIIGSRAGGTADGLNIWDVSGSTMIVSFSKQSIRYYAPVVGPAFDIGGSVYNVRAFGATGDGLTNDTPAIQATIDTALLAGGGEVLFPPGIYSVSTTTIFGHSLRVNNTIAFQGQSGSWLRFASSHTSACALLRIEASTYTSVNGVQIRGLGFDGNNVYRAVGISAIYTKDLVLDNCKFKNFRGENLPNPAYCVYSSGSSQGTPASPYPWTTATPLGWTVGTNIGNCSFSSSTDADCMFIYKTDGASLANNVIDTAARACFVLGWNRRVTVAYNQVRNCTDDGIRIGADESILSTDPRDTTDVVIVGNVIEGCQRDGIRFTANRSTCLGNTSSFNTLSGMQTVVALDCTIANNIFASNRNHGIHFARSTVTTWDTHRNTVVSGNVCKQNAGRGIIVLGGGPSVTTAATGLRVTANICSDNSADGIAMWDCDDTCEVVGNTCVSNYSNVPGSVGGNGISISNSEMRTGNGGLLIAWNRVYDSRSTPQAMQVRGITVSNTTAGSNTTGCRLYWNDLSGTTSNITINGTGISTNLAVGTQSSSVLLGNRYQRVVIPTALLSGDTELFRVDQGQFNAAGGAAVFPVYNFSSETSLGWYRSATSVMALSYGSLAVDALAPNSTATISAVSAFKVDGFARTDGIALRAVAAGNYEIRHFGTGGFEIASDNGGLTLSAGTSTDALVLRTGSTPTGRVTVRSGGTTEFNQSVFVANDSLAGPGYAFQSEGSLGWYRSGVNTMAQSLGTLNLATNAVRFSMRTLAASSVTVSAANTNVAINEVVVTVQASGASFAINSGGTTWIFHSDASAKNT